MEWYACIGVNRRFLATSRSTGSYRHIEISIDNGLIVEKMVVEEQVDVRQDVICGVSPKLHDFPPRASLRAPATRRLPLCPR
jgi:hypothetical protein